MKWFVRHINLPVAVVLLFMLSVVASCERKPLYLRGQGSTRIDFADFEVKLELLWGVDWETEWQYEWDEKLWGPIGYTEPDWMRAFFYDVQRNDTSKVRTSNFYEMFTTRKENSVTLKTNAWCDMLFYTAGTEYILFDPASDNSYYNATTRSSSKGQYRARGPRTARDPRALRAFVDRNPPDELVGTPIEDLWISDDPNDYEARLNPDGSTTYIYHIKANLRPYTFIYLYQVMLLNNYDEKGIRVKGCQGMTADGVAEGVELFSRHTYPTQVSVTTDDGDVKPLQAHRMLTLPDGTRTEGDIFAARMLTWGLPDMVPLDYFSRGVTQDRSDIFHTLGIGLVLRNGQVYTVEEDVTEQMEKKPTGGVITVVLDTKEIPDSIINEPPTPPSGGGAFNASVKDWENIINAIIEI